MTPQDHANGEGYDDVSHQMGRMSLDDRRNSSTRYFYAAAHSGWYAVFEQTDPRPGYWRVCVDGLLNFTDAADVAARLNGLSLPLRAA